MESNSSSNSSSSRISLQLLCDEELHLPSPSPSPLHSQQNSELHLPTPSPLQSQQNSVLHLPTPSPSPSPLQSQRNSEQSSAGSPLLCSIEATDEERDCSLRNYLLRERRHAPRPGYADHLRCSSDLSAARSRALRCILLACSRLNLAIGTAFNAANYLDRFISRDSSVKWESWMIELLCITCLSIAAKMDEVFIPSLHDFQMDVLDHSFQPSTIQLMELTVLKALDWRLTCVTPYSYVELLLLQGMDAIDAPLTSRITELLLRALVDARFIKYRASSITASALSCALQELVPLDSHNRLSILTRLMHEEHIMEMDKCHKVMEEQVACPAMARWKYRCPESPVTVIPLQKAGILDFNSDIDGCFFSSPGPSPDLMKRKREEDVGISIDSSASAELLLE